MYISKQLYDYLCNCKNTPYFLLLQISRIIFIFGQIQFKNKARACHHDGTGLRIKKYDYEEYKY